MAMTLKKLIKKSTCLCGCGVATNAQFVPGHDSKLHSELVRKMNSNDSDLPKVVLSNYQNIKFIVKDDELCAFVARVFSNLTP